jgi:hypothetical protein
MPTNFEPQVINTQYPIVKPDGSIFWHDRACDLLIPDNQGYSTDPQTGTRWACGAKPRSRHPQYAAVGSIPGVPTFTEWQAPIAFDFPIIPKESWSEAIKEAEAKKMFPFNHVNTPAHNQDGLGYCWIYCSTQAAISMRDMSGQPHRVLSACSVGAPVNNFSNSGGWPLEGMQYAAKNGWCCQDAWKDLSLSRDNMTKPDVIAQRPFYKITEMLDVDGSGDTLRSHIITLLCHGIPLVITYSWWNHAIWMARVRADGSALLATIMNSWGNWGYANEHNITAFGDYDLYGRGLPGDTQALIRMGDHSHGA